MILNGINFGTTFYGLYIVEHYGRRKSLIFGSTWMFIMFLIFASVGHFSLDRNDPESTESSATALIVMASFFIFGFATTWGPMIWTICGELYPSRYRAKGMALSTASNWFWYVSTLSYSVQYSDLHVHRNFLLAFFTPFIVSAIDFRYGYVFAGCNVLGGLLIYFFVLEGQGRTLEELDTMYIQNVLPWKSSEWVAPPPEEIARIRAQAGTSETHDAEIGIARGDSNIAPAPEKDSMDSESTHGEKVAEREAQQAREEAEARERADAGHRE